MLASAVRLDLRAIEASLRFTQRALGRQQTASGADRDPMGEPVVENMLAGYERVDALAAEGVDPFAMGKLKHLLELNALVLCGTDPARRAQYGDHFEATEKRFYGENDASVEDVVEAHREGARQSAWERAAGVYAGILCKPQLFIEGNHRTGALIMSYVLVQGGEPPFVLSPGNAAEYFASSSAFRDVDKRSLTAFVRLAGMSKRFAEFLQRQSRAEYIFRG